MEIPRKNSLPNSPSFFKALSCHRAPPMTFSGAGARKRRPARLKGGVVVFFPEIIDEPINQGDLYWLWTDNQSSIRLINDPINKDGTVYQLDPYYNLHWLLISIIEMGWLINGMVDEWDGWLMWDAHWLSMRWQNNVGWFSGFREIVGTCPGNVGWSRHLVISELNWGLRHAQPVFAQSLQNAAVDDDGNWLSYSDGNHVYYMKKHVASPNIIPNIIPSFPKKLGLSYWVCLKMGHTPFNNHHKQRGKWPVSLLEPSNLSERWPPGTPPPRLFPWFGLRHHERCQRPRCWDLVPMQGGYPLVI